MKMGQLLAFLLVCGMAFSQSPPASKPMRVIGENKGVSAPPAAGDSDRILASLIAEPRGKSTLIGGTIQQLDNVRDRLVVRAFGGRDVAILFDDRTLVTRDGAAASPRDFRAGQRVYADTALAGKDIFARWVRILTQSVEGQSNGQVLTYDPASRELSLRDALASEPAKFQLAQNAIIVRDGQPASITELRPGSLVALKFRPSTDGPAVASEVSILAIPGAAFVFVGQVSHLDLHTGLLVLVDPRDQKSYDIHFDSTTPGIDDTLHEGSQIVATTSFDGTRYTASNIRINPAIGK